MNKYHVYIEIYGKKMRVEVEADTRANAEAKVRGRLNILKSEFVSPPNPDPLNLKKLFDQFGDILK